LRPVLIPDTVLFDFHIHTNYSSDGILSPLQVISAVRSRDFSAFSITDHNTVSSVKQVLRDFQGQGGITFVPAAELSTYFEGTEIHLIPYGIDPYDAVLEGLLEEFDANRLTQARKRTEKVRELGFTIDFERLVEASEGKTPSGVTFLKVLSEHEENLERLEPYITGEKSASPYTNFYFDYFFKGGYAYVDVSLLDYRNTVGLLRDKSVLVVAHPGLYPQERLEELFMEGVEGIEVYSSYHDDAKRAAYADFAENRGLLITAGSDFHGERIKPGIHLGGHGCPDDSVRDRLTERINMKKLLSVSV
jgi:predicted metal-dependent phosphoesterase TrpH